MRRFVPCSILNARACRAVIAFLGCIAIALHAGGASAAAPDTLATCVARIVHAARAQHARPLDAPAVDFLLSGERDTYHYRLPQDGCLGLLAVGHRQVQHLGLSLFAPTGRVLSQADARDTHAYTRFCGRAGRRFIAEVSMLDGQGEYHLVPLWHAPAVLKGLESTMASCMHVGDRRPELEDVGPEPLGRPIELEQQSVAEELTALGYRLNGNVLSGTLRQRRRELRRVMLPGGQCIALAAVGDADVEDIDMRLLAVSDSATLLASDVSRHRHSVLKVCPEDAGVYVLDVRMYRGAGRYVVQSYSLVESAAPPAGIEGNTRIAYAEMRATLAARGLGTTPVTWGLLQPEATHSIPVSVRAGRCYAVGAIASADFATGDLDLMLVDEGGNLAAAEVGPNAHPVVFYCSDRDSIVHAVLRGRDVHRSARFLLLLGEGGQGSQHARASHMNSAMMRGTL